MGLLRLLLPLREGGRHVVRTAIPDDNYCVEGAVGG